LFNFDPSLQDALARCAAQLESSAQEVLTLRDDISAAAAASHSAPTSDLHDLKMLSSAQSRLSNIVQVAADISEALEGLLLHFTSRNHAATTNLSTCSSANHL
jgi:hypothetical protein